MTPQRFQKIQAALRRRQPDLTILAEGVHKSHNLSALVRSCDATGVFEIHVVAPDGEIPRHHLVAGGSWKWVRPRVHAHVLQAIEHLKKDGFHVIAAHFSETAVDYRDLDYTRPTAVLLGTELHGVSPEAAAAADCHTVIPMRGLVASLNVSVANALILFEAARQREAAGLYEHSRLDAETWRRTLFEWCYPDVARRCRRHGLGYPRLGRHGELLENPFRDDPDQGR